MTLLFNLCLPAQAIEDIGNLQIGKWQQLMVPIHEMTDVLRVVKDAASSSLKRGSWVRVKRGMYKDDIASVSVNTNMYTNLCKCLLACLNYSVSTTVNTPTPHMGHCIPLLLVSSCYPVPSG